MGRTICGVEFAPLSVPLHRRLQTLAALYASFMFFSGIPAVAVLIYLLFTKYYWMTVLYLTWIWYDRNTSARGGRRNGPFAWLLKHSQAHVKYLRDYFPLSLVKTADLDPSQKYIMGYHPHGLMGFGLNNLLTNVTGFQDKFPGITTYSVAVKLLLLMPFSREWLLASGVCDASRESIEYILRTKGNAVIILLGGAKEVFEAFPRETRLVLKSRQGFVKVALRNGAHLVPCFTFGENELYRPLLNNRPGTRLRQFQRFVLKYCNFTLFFATGRGLFNYDFGIIPMRHPVVTVVGRPIVLEQDDNPSPEKVTAIHELYMTELRALFEEHKASYGYEDQTMEFVE